jgi:hypothetical protein
MSSVQNSGSSSIVEEVKKIYNLSIKPRWNELSIGLTIKNKSPNVKNKELS